MLEVTPEAKAQLKTVAGIQKLEPGQILRLAVPPVWTGQGDWGIVIDQRGAADIAYAYEGATVLIIEEEVAQSLANSILDYKTEDVPSPRFTLDIY
ncbi:MAG: hypothetical protein FI734_01695 [SAR202 cluster bacterium]|nr:hypothetical protein [SAR202 cluster bacterium]|tara:strand:+ start:26771 stop:27058 length:288 start_codon:yes stop_codon:yes gene_type:complete